MKDPKSQPMFERHHDLEDKTDGPDVWSAVEASEKRAAPLVGSGGWLGVRVICPSAPKYARRGYRGSGYIGRVCEDLGDKVNVTYSNGSRRVWHKSHLSRLSA